MKKHFNKENARSFWDGERTTRNKPSKGVTFSKYKSTYKKAFKIKKITKTELILLIINLMAFIWNVLVLLAYLILVQAERIELSYIAIISTLTKTIFFGLMTSYLLDKTKKVRQ